ncbi:helix-turn-helix domain-containing protein [Bacteroides sp.]|uniref:helix-turn-helix domain-containing protein n=1 Tax=Bacteroides sp. TaxID=29523 RepID=UPI003AB312B5
MDDMKVLKYSDIFLTMYFNDKRLCLCRNLHHTLVYLCSGEMEINESGKITKLHSGDCAFIRKDCAMQMTKQGIDGEQFKGIFLVFSPKFLRDFYQNLNKTMLPADVSKSKKSLYLLPSKRPDIVSLFESMFPYFDSAIEPTEELLKLKMIEGIYVLLNTDKSLYASLFDFADPWKIDILEFLTENYMYDLSMEEIASFTGRSLATFKRDFAKVSDLTPQRWIIQKRLEVAHDQIVHKGRKVSEVYADVGFKNLSHFSRSYKQAYGAAPTK